MPRSKNGRGISFAPLEIMIIVNDIESSGLKDFLDSVDDKDREIVKFSPKVQKVILNSTPRGKVVVETFDLADYLCEVQGGRTTTSSLICNLSDLLSSSEISDDLKKRILINFE